MHLRPHIYRIIKSPQPQIIKTAQRTLFSFDLYLSSNSLFLSFYYCVIVNKKYYVDVLIRFSMVSQGRGWGKVRGGGCRDISYLEVNFNMV